MITNLDSWLVLRRSYRLMPQSYWPRGDNEMLRTDWPRPPFLKLSVTLCEESLQVGRKYMALRRRAFNAVRRCGETASNTRKRHTRVFTVLVMNRTLPVSSLEGFAETMRQRESRTFTKSSQIGNFSRRLWKAIHRSIIFNALWDSDGDAYRLYHRVRNPFSESCHFC